MSRWVYIVCMVLSIRVGAEDIAECFPQAATRARISIIIDDLGYGIDRGRRLATLPHNIMFAVIPFTPYGSDIARLAHRHDKEIMLHAPMEPLGWSRWETGLTAAMGERELAAAMDKMLQDIPHVVGVNNHGGSKLTQDRARMNWVMRYLAQKRLYFVDSRTVSSSTAADAARQADVAHSSRDIFLDNKKDPVSIKRQLDKLRAIATAKGRAIAIGHPYPETISTLVEELPSFYRQGIELVSVSDLLEHELLANSSMVAVQHDVKGETARTP